MNREAMQIESWMVNPKLLSAFIIIRLDAEDMPDFG
jgi:hypothetical protein